MQILNAILSLFLNEENKEKIAPLVDAILKNGFDLPAILKSVDLSALLPLIESLFVNKREKPVYSANPLSPVVDIADAEIISALNKYVSAV